MKVDSKVGKELSYFIFTHLTRMTFLVKQDEAFNPVSVSVLGFEAIVLKASDSANLIE